MKKKLEKIKQEKEAGTNLNCEIDEESNGLVCIGQTVGNIYCAPKKSCPSIVLYSLHTKRQDFLVIQYQEVTFLVGM